MQFTPYTEHISIKAYNLVVCWIFDRDELLIRIDQKLLCTLSYVW